MKDKLASIMKSEKTAIADLLNLLEEQHKYILTNDTFNLDAIVGKIKNASIEIAKHEMERRNLTGDAPMSQVIRELNDKCLENLLYEVRGLLENVKVQKETNELLIKQSLVLVNKMLNYINPNREVKTYNGYGKMRR